MDEMQAWQAATLGQRAVAALVRNGFTAQFLASGREAADYVLSRVPKGASIGFGGSRTVQELGLAATLSARGHTVFDHGRPGLSREEQVAARYRQLTADIFVCSSNAVTLRGELVNRDAVGNRVAAMIFGPKSVFVIVGANKLVRDLEEAERRIRLVAAPLNNRRFATKNPCVQQGECVDCRSEARLCNITTVISRRPPLTDMHVLILGEALGF